MASGVAIDADEQIVLKLANLFMKINTFVTQSKLPDSNMELNWRMDGL